MRPALLSLRNVSVVFKGRGGTVSAVRDVSLDITPGEIVSVVGESGSGKTTLGRVATLLQSPTSGSVLYKGLDTARIPKPDLQRIKIRLQYVYQDPYSSLNPVKSVYETLSVVIRTHRKGIPESEVRRLVVDLLERVGLTPPEYFLNKYPHHLSGGMRQRLSIARALIPNPELIVADEPVSMIDPSMKVSVLDLLKDLNVKSGVSLLYITHELGTIRYLAPTSKMLVMLRGFVMEEGVAEEVMRKPLHPYSLALIAFGSAFEPKLKSMRDLFVKHAEYEGAPSAGCPFAARCPWAREKCFKERPPLVEYAGRKVACHFPGELEQYW
ncbi:MAG: ABC transporter ATP-binding protein [Thermofilaceae archaeon]